MSGVDGLRAAVAAAPGDWLARSALADYLEEQGAAEAATVRAEAERLRQLADRLAAVTDRLPRPGRDYQPAVGDQVTAHTAAGFGWLSPGELYTVVRPPADGRLILRPAKLTSRQLKDIAAGHTLHDREVPAERLTRPELSRLSRRVGHARWTLNRDPAAAELLIRVLENERPKDGNQGR